MLFPGSVHTTKRSTFYALLLIAFLAISLPALARAGGGSNSSSGGGIVELILLPFFMIYSAYVSYRLRKRNKECLSLLEQISKRETGWSASDLQNIASQVFMNVQQYWVNLDKDKLASLSKGKAKLQLLEQTDQLLGQDYKNRMDDLSIDKITVLNVQNFLDDEQDSFTAKIEAKARDYTIDSQGLFVKANSRSKKTITSAQDVPLESFTEFWTFEREGDGWVVLDIAQVDAWRSVLEMPFVDEGTLPQSASNRTPQTARALGTVVPTT